MSREAVLALQKAHLHLKFSTAQRLAFGSDLSSGREAADQINYICTISGPKLAENLAMRALLLFAVLASALWVSNKSDAQEASTHYSIIINMAGKSWRGHGNLDIDEAQIMMRLESIFPRTNFLVVRAFKPDEIKKELERLISRDAKIDVIYFVSHGGSTEGNGQPSSINLNGGDIELLNVRQMKTVFGGLAGRFHSQSKVIFSACDLIAIGDSPQEKLRYMAEVSQSIGLEEGSVFMSDVMTHTGIRTVFDQPPTHQPGVLKLIYGAAWVLMPITYPYFLITDRLIFNKGYTVVIKNGFASLYADNLFNAEMNPLPASCVLNFEKQIFCKPQMDKPLANQSYPAARFP